MYRTAYRTVPRCRADAAAQGNDRSAKRLPSSQQQMTSLPELYCTVTIHCCLCGCCRADSAAKGDDRTAKLPAVITAADDVIAAINATELAAFLAMRAPADDADAGSSGSNGGSGGSDGGSSAAQSYKETKGVSCWSSSSMCSSASTWVLNACAG
jgi:hypothetical protein